MQVAAEAAAPLPEPGTCDTQLKAGQGLFAKLLGLVKRPVCCASNTEGCQALLPSWEVRALSLVSHPGKSTAQGNGRSLLLWWGRHRAAEGARSAKRTKSHRCLLS